MSLLRRIVLATLACALAACAGLPGREPLEAYVVGVEPLEGQGLELRMLVKLRVQNPNDRPVDYDVVHVALDVQGRPFATGVSDATGSVPRFGETVIGVPVSISAFRLARSAVALANSQSDGKIAYALRGKLAGAGFSAMRFRSSGEMVLPRGVYADEAAASPR